MDIFDLSISEFEQEMKKIVDGYLPEELLAELKQCGYKKDECIYIEENISKEKYSTKELSEDNSLYIEFLSLENSSECMELGVAA